MLEFTLLQLVNSGRLDLALTMYDQIHLPWVPATTHRWGFDDALSIVARQDSCSWYQDTYRHTFKPLCTTSICECWADIKPRVAHAVLTTWLSSCWTYSPTLHEERCSPQPPSSFCLLTRNSQARGTASLVPQTSCVAAKLSRAEKQPCVK